MTVYDKAYFRYSDDKKNFIREAKEQGVYHRYNVTTEQAVEMWNKLQLMDNPKSFKFYNPNK